MEFVHALFRERLTLLGGDGRGDEAACVGVVLESFEQPAHVRWNRRARAHGELAHLHEVRDGHDAGDDWHRDTGALRTLDKAEVDVVVEEELRNGACGAGVDLALEVVEVDVQ